MRGPYRRRLVQGPPRINQFKPSGIPARSIQSIILNIDEYEGIRLADYQGLDHTTAAGQMGISRPTFSRLIEKARSKVAQALIDGKMLTIEGGNFDFTHQLYQCEDCGDTIEQPIEQALDECPDCGSKNVNDFTSHHGHHGRARHHS